MNNKLILYKENIFTKISNWIKRLFVKGKNDIKENEVKTIDDKKIEKNMFNERIIIKENPEEKRVKELQIKYDNGEIDEDDISDEDIDKLVKMYEKETEELNADTERRKIHIEQMLKELKKEN